ncbi:hypothetical protein, partial [Streptomyces sp. NPDC001250]
RWNLQTTSGTYAARVVIVATGPWHRPRHPDIRVHTPGDASDRTYPRHVLCGGDVHGFRHESAPPAFGRG